MSHRPVACRLGWLLVFVCCLTVVSFAAPGVGVQTQGTLHDGLVLARENRTADPLAESAFRRLAKEFGTPLYIYDRTIIDQQANTLKKAFSERFPKLRLFYAIKANTSLALISLLRQHGFGTEVVSGGEVHTALHLGVPGSDIMYTSSSKSPWEIELALREGVTLNVDSLDELVQIEVAASRLRTTARISFRINPGVDPHTIHQINTGLTETKFGLHLEGGHRL